MSHTSTANFTLNRIREDAVDNYSHITRLGGQPQPGLAVEQALAGLLDHLGNMAVQLSASHPMEPGLIALTREITTLRLAIHGKGAR